MKYFDSEEKTLIESFEKGDWVSNKKPGHLAAIRKAAKEALKKSERINIRISSKDLTDVKRMASLEGIPYQTFVSSIIHKAANRRA